MAGRGSAVVRSVRDPRLAQRLNEVAGVVTVALAVFVFLGVLSFHPGHPRANLGGPIGHGIGSLLVPVFGRAAFLLPVYLAGLGVRLFRRGFAELSVVRLVAAVGALAGVSVLLGLLLPASEVARAGGWFGGFVATVLREAFGAAGSVVVTGAGCVLALMFSTRWTVQAAAAAMGGRLRALAARLRPGVSVPPEEDAAAPADRGTRGRRIPAPARPAPPVIVLREPVDGEAEGRPGRDAPQPSLPFGGDGAYELPPLALLDPPRRAAARVDAEALRRSSEILEAKLANFGIEGRVVAVRPGPVITTFEIEPAPGVKVNRITNLQDDLAMALRAEGVRILAPVPGKAVVGIEVANREREAVTLSEILASDAFAQATSTLTLALGKDSVGTPVVADLARMPHLLMAGATGTGKSVSINAMIMSILHKATPRDVRFVLIDLKMLELSLYEELPHLLVPVVTDPRKAVIVLKNLVEQMDERYRLLKEQGVRHIDSYNRVVEHEAGPGGIIELTELVDDAQDEAPPARRERLPKIVVIIDELADLMMTVGRHVEEPVTRLAQKARAAGIHLICATQRPSVDVITGLIKANFPARLSFQVTARVDSRTILDTIGAERLLGGGDMLFLPPGQARVQRLHGAYVSEAEIRKVVAFARRQATPAYALELLEGREDDETGRPGEEEPFEDEMYDKAVRLVTESRQASISWVQRQLRIGYNRAARMIERMEREGVVSASEGGRPREVLVQALEDR